MTTPEQPPQPPIPPQPAYGYPQPGWPAAPTAPPVAPAKGWRRSAKIAAAVTTAVLVIGGTVLTTLALTNNPETTTTTGSDKASAPTDYRADNLSADEKAFFDVMFNESRNKDELSKKTAAEIAQMVTLTRLACALPEDERADALAKDKPPTNSDTINKAFKDHLCKGVPAPLETQAEPTKEDPSQGHTGDVVITKAGNKPEYGIKKYEATYKITNSGTQAASYWIKFEAYDKDGDFLGESHASAKRLGVGKSETGDVTFYDHTIKEQDPAVIASVKVKEVTYCDGTSTNYMCASFNN
ncbi:hypothetical protein [Streptomyces sp. AP-93]|uniref:hypothetical protein n=1 Tax=Streptomyces sp. AP-93 TaxID=2929048 RepID=UPI001FAFB1D6|nr:hypothetical protein [Streptomyces sp. AP-93]MCJ0868077.1 hypothetical protein [Streptomyces sp. AP-93]